MGVAFPVLVITQRAIYMLSPSTCIPELVFAFYTFLC